MGIYIMPNIGRIKIVGMVFLFHPNVMQIVRHLIRLGIGSRGGTFARKSHLE